MPDELDRLIEGMQHNGVIAIREVQQVDRYVFSQAQEYEAERRIRELCIREVAAWIDVDWKTLPLNPEMAWEALHGEFEASAELHGKLFDQLEKAREVLDELQEGLTDEFAGTGLGDDGLILKVLVDGLRPAVNEDGSGVEQEEIDKLQKLTAGLIKLAEECYDVLREK